jgi:putative transposase
MADQYHLCVRTEEANLACGMQWLQSTFANRFNRRVRGRGHLFQGRYRALLVEEGEALLRVVNTIHLSPVHSGIQDVETLRRYELSSFPKFFRHRRPACLVSRDWLRWAGNLKPTAAGMRGYHRALAAEAQEQADRLAAVHREVCRGWYIGTREGKKALVQAQHQGRVGAGRKGKASGHGSERAATLLRQGLRRLGKGPRDLQEGRKLAQWKAILAGWIKLQCGVSNRWFSENMQMGSIYSVSKAVAQELKRKGQGRLWRALGLPQAKACP